MVRTGQHRIVVVVVQVVVIMVVPVTHMVAVTTFMIKSSTERVFTAPSSCLLSLASLPPCPHRWTLDKHSTSLSDHKTNTEPAVFPTHESGISLH